MYHTTMLSKENRAQPGGEPARNFSDSSWQAQLSLSATALRADGYILFLFGGEKIHSTINDSLSRSSTMFFFMKNKKRIQKGFPWLLSNSFIYNKMHFKCVLFAV